MIIGCVPALAGAGASSLLLSAAARLGASGRKVLIIDADPLAEISARLGKRPARPLADLFRPGRPPLSAQPLAPGVSLLAGEPGRYLGGGVGVTAQALRAAAGAGLGDVIFIDLPPSGSPSTEAALPLLDAVVVACPAHAAGVRALPSLLRLVLASKTAPSGPPRLAALAVGPVRPAERSDSLAKAIASRCPQAQTTLVVPFEPEIERASEEQRMPRLSPGNYFDVIERLVRNLAVPLASNLGRVEAEGGPPARAAQAR